MSEQRFLVLYDYGQGGVWAYVLAESRDEIVKRYPQLRVYDEPPPWLTPSELAKISASMTIRLSDATHPFLAALAAPIVIVVEDTYVIRGTGVVVAPGLDSDRLPHASRLLIETLDQHGNSRQIRGRFLVEHFRLIGGGSKWQGAIVLDQEYAGAVEPGTRLTARVEEA